MKNLESLSAVRIVCGLLLIVLTFVMVATPTPVAHAEEFIAGLAGVGLLLG